MMTRPWKNTERNIPVRLPCSDTKVSVRWTLPSCGRRPWIRRHRRLRLVEIEDARLAACCNRDADGNGSAAKTEIYL